jgi:two-component system, OmpR family, KDP operon response regulator KdpE
LVTGAPLWSPSSELHRELAGATILVIENEVSLAEATAAAFTACGAMVCHAETGADARAMLKRAPPDAILLDLSLPDVDGLVLCPTLRTEGGDVPIIVFSPAPDRSTTLLAFHLGADDVVNKPFDLVELQARVAVALRRRHARGAPAPVASLPAQRARLTLGAMALDVPAWRATVGDHLLHLTPTEFRVLVFLTQRAGEFVSREELAREVWGDASVSGSRTIDAYMRRVRDKLVASGGPHLLHVRGLGYQLVAVSSS